MQRRACVPERRVAGSAGGGDEGQCAGCWRVDGCKGMTCRHRRRLQEVHRLRPLSHHNQHSQCCCKGVGGTQGPWVAVERSGDSARGTDRCRSQDAQGGTLQPISCPLRTCGAERVSNKSRRRSESTPGD